MRVGRGLRWHQQSGHSVFKALLLLLVSVASLRHGKSKIEIEHLPRDILQTLDSAALRLLTPFTNDTHRYLFQTTPDCASYSNFGWSVGSKKKKGKLNDFSSFRSDDDCGSFVSQERCDSSRKVVTWLASFPHSGNTWTRVMIEMSTRMKTGSVYIDGSLRRAGLLGENIKDPSRVIAVKTHKKSLSISEPEGRAILLLRNPLDAALSATYGLNHNEEWAEDVLVSKFEEGLEVLLQDWREHTIYWTQLYQGEKVLLKYEDIVANPEPMYLDHILPFLGINPALATVRDNVRCSVAASALPSIKRQHTYEFHFTDLHRETARRIVGDIATQVGYTI